MDGDVGSEQQKDGRKKLLPQAPDAAENNLFNGQGRDQDQFEGAGLLFLEEPVDSSIRIGRGQNQQKGRQQRLKGIGIIPVDDGAFQENKEEAILSCHERSTHHPAKRSAAKSTMDARAKSSARILEGG